MATRANVAIRDNEENYHRNSDIILLYRHWDGYPEGIGGCIKMFIRAYDHAIEAGTIGRCKAQTQGLATSLILVGEGTFEPASFQCYQDFFSEGSFSGVDYVYHIVFSDEYDQKDNPEIEITVSRTYASDTIPPLKRSIKEWRRFDDVNTAWASMVEGYSAPQINKGSEDVDPKVMNSLYFREINPQFLNEIYGKLGPCPCDTCMVRATCIQTPASKRSRRDHRMGGKCGEKQSYEVKVKIFLKGSLSHDSDLQKLFRESIR